MSLLNECSKCGRHEVGGDRVTGVCHRCRDAVVVEHSDASKTSTENGHSNLEHSEPARTPEQTA
jgi:hypothetical protein